MLCEGYYEPGQALSIRRLAQKFGIGHMPAREALRSLVAEGALEFADSRTIIVPKLSKQKILDVLFARKVLEGELSRRAFDNISERDTQQLKKIDESINKAIASSNVRAYMKKNYKFHFYIYRLGESPVLLHLIEILWLQYGPCMRYIMSGWDGSDFESDYHLAITDALVEKNPAAFQKAVENDIEQGISFIIDKL